MPRIKTLVTPKAEWQREKFEKIIESLGGTDYTHVLWEHDFPTFILTCYNVMGEAVINQVFKDGCGSFMYTIEGGRTWESTEAYLKNKFKITTKQQS